MKLHSRHSEETKRKISQSRKGKLTGSDNHNYKKNFSAETRLRMSLSHMGKTMPLEQRKKISASMKKNKKVINSLRELNKFKRGIPLSDKIKAKMSEVKMGEKNPMFGKHLSESTKQKLSIAFTGNKHPNWQGGKSFEPYGKKFNRILKRQIRERDNFICAICWKKEDGRAHSVHHIDFNKRNNDPSNLITLCGGCHALTSHKRKKWIKFFQSQNIVLRPSIEIKVNQQM